MIWFGINNGLREELPEEGGRAVRKTPPVGHNYLPERRHKQKVIIESVEGSMHSSFEIVTAGQSKISFA